MQAQTANILRQLNNRFYREQSASFAATRGRPWQGWTRVVACAEDLASANGATAGVTVFDLACGNLRFENYLLQCWPQAPLEFYAVDCCEALLPGKPLVHFQDLDIIARLIAGRRISDAITAPACELAVCFGFMHHIPASRLRIEALRCLIAHTAPGGYAAVSFWQFMEDEAFAARVPKVHEQALANLGLAPESLDEGDYLRGWQGKPGAYRYCHSFSDTQIDHLVAAVGKEARPVARFKADGKSGRLNAYVVFKRE
jgi:hypothetical protein